MVTAPCGICGASARLQFRGHPAYQAPATFDMFHCSNCETRFAAPGLFLPLARLCIGTRTLGRWRSAPYRDSLSLCAVMRKDGAAP
jgi:hypothetical protein